MNFDIIIPTYNNLEYLKLAINSIIKNSTFNHDIFVHVNEGSDGTLDWLNVNNIKYTYFEENKGVCEGSNWAASLGNNDYIVYFNDDMVALPKWDKELINYLNELNTNKFFICSTPIEPVGKNPNCIIKDYGKTINEFDENSIVNDLEFLQNQKPNLNSTWSPFLVPRKLWNEVNGYSIEFEPGQGSDPDLCKKLYDIGVREFTGVGKSLIYHFQSLTNKRIKKNNSKEIFQKKYNMTMDYFVNEIIKRAQKTEKRKELK